jgi:hypothetical protein
MIEWDEKWPELRYGDVFPLPLATETNWADTWQVNVLMLLQADGNGYSSRTVWSYTEPYAEPGRGTREEAAEVTERALSAFADRLREVLAEPA